MPLRTPSPARRPPSGPPPRSRRPRNPAQVRLQDAARTSARMRASARAMRRASSTPDSARPRRWSSMASANAMIPSPAVATAVSTGGFHPGTPASSASASAPTPPATPAATQPDRVAQPPHERARLRAVRLVDHEDVGHLGKPGLHGLHFVARFGREHHHHRIGGFRHPQLGLADPHGLQKDAAESAPLHQVDHVVHRLGQAAARPARRHRTNEDAPVELERRHAHTVSQQRAPGVGRSGIHRHDRHLLACVAPNPGERRRQGRLPRPGRTGDPGPVGPAAVRGHLCQQLTEARAPVLHHRNGPRQRRPLTRAAPLRERARHLALRRLPARYGCHRRDPSPRAWRNGLSSRCAGTTSTTRNSTSAASSPAASTQTLSSEM